MQDQQQNITKKKKNHFDQGRVLLTKIFMGL